MYSRDRLYGSKKPVQADAGYAHSLAKEQHIGMPANAVHRRKIA
jgi:hypothetical protein